jgi:hypothetical protein
MPVRRPPIPLAPMTWIQTDRVIRTRNPTALPCRAGCRCRRVRSDCGFDLIFQSHDTSPGASP